MSEPRTSSDPAGPVHGAARGPIPATGEPGVEAFGYTQELKRSLSFSDLLVYGLVFMVPIAPFGIFGSVFQASGGMIALAYAIATTLHLTTGEQVPTIFAISRPESVARRDAASA